jgi:rare lipoprotein A
MDHATGDSSQAVCARAKWRHAAFALYLAASTPMLIPMSSPVAMPVPSANWPPVFAAPVPTQPEQPAYSQLGAATWYNQAGATASGESFNARALTAAHRTLPFGTIVRVTNVIDGRWVKVRINDRGPFMRGRIVDLSQAAARALGIEHGGMARVRLEAFASDQP